MATAGKTQYEDFSTEYTSLSDTPQGQLERELVSTALGDCTGLKVLDIGGGSGLHARKAVDAGAEVVDLIDVSPAMLDVGKAIEAQLGRQDRIRWHEGDATKSFSHLPLAEEYDVVLTSWVFDHATTISELDSMWRNAAAHLRPGGKMINVRVTNYLSPAVHPPGKYGLDFEDIEEIPGGVRYKVNVRTQPPFSFEGTSMNETHSLSSEIAQRHGFTAVHVMPPEDTELVKRDVDFWKMFVNDPSWAVLTATKKA